MAKIIVSLADTQEQEHVCAELRLKKHQVAALPEPITVADNIREKVAGMLEDKADVIIIDYLPDDAASVKMLQTATEYAHSPRFIFILPGDVSVAHILMAVNEGAAALLQRPINDEALANYVERAISGPARFRHEIGRSNTVTKEIKDLERDAKTMKTQLAANRKLISFLVSTSAANQHRTVLIVSDSAYQRDYLRNLLEDHGFHVHQAPDSEEGLQVALKEKPRIIVSDLEMQGKNGVDFCHDLKIIHKFIPCHFIICTANHEKIDSVMAPGNGVDACILKPSGEDGNRELIVNVAMGLLL